MSAHVDNYNVHGAIQGRRPNKLVIDDCSATCNFSQTEENYKVVVVPHAGPCILCVRTCNCRRFKNKWPTRMPVKLTGANGLMYRTINQFIDYGDGPSWQDD